jgi:hypothetical protein
VFATFPTASSIRRWVTSRTLALISLLILPGSGSADETPTAPSSSTPRFELSPGDANPPMKLLTPTWEAAGEKHETTRALVESLERRMLQPLVPQVEPTPLTEPVRGGRLTGPLLAEPPPIDGPPLPSLPASDVARWAIVAPRLRSEPRTLLLVDEFFADASIRRFDVELTGADAESPGTTISPEFRLGFRRGHRFHAFAAQSVNASQGMSLARVNEYDLQLGLESMRRAGWRGRIHLSGSWLEGRVRSRPEEWRVLMVDPGVRREDLPRNDPPSRNYRWNGERLVEVPREADFVFDLFASALELAIGESLRDLTNPPAYREVDLGDPFVRTAPVYGLHRLQGFGGKLGLGVDWQDERTGLIGCLSGEAGGYFGGGDTTAIGVLGVKTGLAWERNWRRSTLRPDGGYEWRSWYLRGLKPKRGEEWLITPVHEIDRIRVAGPFLRFSLLW